jgi:aspartate/methionine/tyrosine aminotransferase
MTLPLFKLEDYFSQWEFKASHLLCASDMEAWSMQELLSFADTECRQLWDNLQLGYTQTQGFPLLREEISQLYTHVHPSQVLCTVGAEEAIFCTMQALLTPGDHVIIITPCYQSLEALPRALTPHVTAIPLDPEKNWALDLEKVREAFKPWTKLLVINFPHNPTGTLIDLNTQKQLVEIARQHHAYILSDEVYRYLEHDEQKRLPAMVDSYERGISIAVMTKVFGLGGLRIGWVATRDQALFKKIAHYKHYTSICASAPSEILSLIALRAKDRILERNRKILLDNFNLLQSFLQTHQDTFSWTPSSAGCIGFIKLLAEQSVADFAHQLVHEESVLILPSYVYDYSGNYFRVGFGRENFPEALAKLEKFLKEKTQ